VRLSPGCDHRGVRTGARPAFGRAEAGLEGGSGGLRPLR
jgi:hypothetical protein